MGLKWGDMYRRTNALGFTTLEDAVYHSSKPAPLPSPSYNIREDLFERDEDFFQEMGGQDFQVGSVYPSYAPSRQTNTSFSLILPAINEDGDDEIYFPSYDDVECSDKVELVESPTETAPVTKRPVSPDPIERPEDDSAIRVQPSRHVDYLSHDWSEEDVWASWQHIVSKRGAYNNSARLENASWRSWAKKRSNLRTVPPETVKWMKDHDLTWLYGPLTPGPCTFGEECSTSNKGRRMSRAEIARHSKKPILKKRSISEIMLRRSISSSLLLKQTVVAKLGKDRTPGAFPFESPALTRSNTNTGMLSSKSTSGLETPEGWKKVQFHELVEQCIALANAGDEDHEYHYCSDSDDEVIVMRKSKKRATSKWLPAIQPKKAAPVSKTIEKLPHAPLKYTEELEVVPEEEINDELCSSASASPCSEDDISDPILEDDDNDEEDDMDWQPPAWLQGRKDSVQIVKDRLSDIKMQEDAKVEPTHSHRPQLERRDAVKEEQNVPHVPLAPSRVGSDASIKFELPPCRSQLATFSFNSTPKYQRPRDDYFMVVDPGMTEGESESSVDMSRSASESSEKIESPALGLDNLQRVLVDRVMDEFWVLFNQRWDTYLAQSTVSSPLSPTGPTTPLTARKRRRGGDKTASSRAPQQQRGTDKSNYFEATPEEAPPSPDSKELAHYESFIHRELPRLVHSSIIDAVRRDSQPKEALLIGNLVSIVHDCQDKVFQSYVERKDRDDNMKGLGIMSMDPFQSSQVSKDSGSEHHRSELLDAAFQQPPSQYMGSYRSSIRSSILSSISQSSSIAPTTPGEMVFSDSGHASEITSTMTSPDLCRRGTETSKYSLPRELRGKDPRTMREWDIYDEIDEAVSWSRGF